VPKPFRGHALVAGIGVSQFPSNGMQRDNSHLDVCSKELRVVTDLDELLHASITAARICNGSSRALKNN
jgi:hypothetical protein